MSAGRINDGADHDGAVRLFGAVSGPRHFSPTDGTAGLLCCSHGADTGHQSLNLPDVVGALVDDAIEKKLKRELPKVLKVELEKALKSKDVKEDIGEIAKKVIKKLYKDLSFHHPYIIDRIKV